MREDQGRGLGAGVTVHCRTVDSGRHGRTVWDSCSNRLTAPSHAQEIGGFPGLGGRDANLMSGCVIELRCDAAE